MKLAIRLMSTNRIEFVDQHASITPDEDPIRIPTFEAINRIHIQYPGIIPFSVISQ